MYFTLVMLLYIAAAAVVNVADEKLLLDAGRTVLFYVFSLLVAVANTLFSLPKLSYALKVLCHYLICVFAFYTCFMLPVGMRASGVFIGVILFTVIYFAAFGIISLFRAKYRSNLEKTQSYQKQFKGKK